MNTQPARAKTWKWTSLFHLTRVTMTQAPKPLQEKSTQVWIGKLQLWFEKSSLCITSANTFHTSRQKKLCSFLGLVPAVSQNSETSSLRRRYLGHYSTSVRGRHAVGYRGVIKRRWRFLTISICPARTHCQAATHHPQSPVVSQDPV